MFQCGDTIPSVIALPRIHVRSFAFPACAILSIVPAMVMAQEPAGTIAGVVRDPAGNVIPQAALEAVRRATAQERRAVTGEHGDYSFPALRPGEYEVSVSRPPVLEQACVSRLLKPG